MALTLTGGAGAEADNRQNALGANTLVEIKVADRAAIDKLWKDAEVVGAIYNDHYLRINDDGTMSAQVEGSDAQIAALADDGYEITATLENEAIYWERIAERLQSIEAERRAHEVAREGKSADLNEFGLRAGVMAAAIDREITVNRVDYFSNYAGRFLSVEAWDRDTVQQGPVSGGPPGQPAAGSGPTLAVTWDNGPGTAIGAGGGPRNMSPYVDPDPARDTYLYHRILIRLGPVGSANPPRPSRIRIASSTGAFEEADVNTWVGTALPPHVAGFQRNFHDRYMDPTEIYAAMNQLATEYPNLSQMINTPYKTNGYQRRAQANLGPLGTTFNQPAAAGATDIRVQSTTGIVTGTVLVLGTGATQETRTVASLLTGSSPAPNVRLTAALTNAHAAAEQIIRSGTEIGSGSSASLSASTIVLTSTAWGHQGGNDTTIELRDPGAADAPLTVSVTGKDILVSLGTDSGGQPTSTAAQVVAAINAHPAARALAKATTYRNNAGAGPAHRRTKVNLSDFLTVSAAVPASGIPHDNSHVQRGPFQPQVMRIGKVRDGSKVGVYIFCQQHAREWVTPITCFETASELLKNYATDPLTRDIVDNLDIFIMPVVNPDGAHHSFYNFQSQRRNMTNHCVVGGKTSDDPMAANFWTPRSNPPPPTPQSSGLPYANEDPASRTAWGVDLNRNQSEGTIWDNYVGASHSCTSDVYAGPTPPDATGPSEPEAKNERWVVDTLGPNIKFSNNVHTSGGYYMWAPGSYKPTRETLPAPNIGIEKYFFAGAETVLGRIAEVRGNVVLPERTGPIADVLYSAAGNSADDNYYRKGIIGYSFEAGSDIFVNPTLSVASAAGATGIRSNSTTGMAIGNIIRIEHGGAAPEERKIASIVSPNPASPAPNVMLTEPLTFPHAAGVQIMGGTSQQGVGFFPPYTSEGQFEADEFAAGNFGLLEVALAYSRDKTPPGVEMSGEKASKTPIETTFRYINEPSVIYYTLDGSAPTFASPKWERQGLRRPGEVFEFTTTTTVRWLALDIAGNTSTGSQRFAIDSAAPTTSASVEQSPGFATVTLNGDDAFATGGSGIAETQYRVDGGAWQTYARPFGVMGAGSHTVEFYSVDAAGNIEATKSVTFVVESGRVPVACRLVLQPGKLRAKEQKTVRVMLRLGGSPYEGIRVSLRGPGVSRNLVTNSEGFALARVKPSRAGTLRASVRANDTTTGCSDSSRVLPPRPRSRVAGAQTSGGSGGAGLTGRPR